ncbi:hypothetical protein SD70_22175 [Gordoniibacillus kamchatkensis]|uniref:ABC transmembrane type-1 domain-containing protein n=1 Tax=Gordoniibacillus kamchatkensis TaxID=1590651 RepID=A0ABR5ADQ7_9BACL|nr:amino acid ABC transporter permease [Paenibacillus sp. VKM B-2647]KIL39137.1 hypothetical protein SD70_22175 [Paenibacillus sp. VKM B-2647]
MEFWGVMSDALPTLLKGLSYTVLIALASLVLATIIGLFAGLMRISGNVILRSVAAAYINLIRGTPLLIQILFIYFGLPTVFHVNFSPLAAGIFAVSINIGAYLAEVFRAGIESIDRGQMEAGRSLGFSYAVAMRLIILPQAVRRMTPAFINQFIIGIKDTSMLSVIGVAELTMEGQSIYAMNFKSFEILTLVGLMYFIINYALTVASRWVEKKVAVS